MNEALYLVEILDKSLKPITAVRGFYPLDNAKHFLEYDAELSAVGHARFRVSTQDPIFDPQTGTGDIFVPWANHIRIKRAGVVVWQGVISKNPHMTHRFVEVQASTYITWLSKVLVANSPVKAGVPNSDSYRTFDSGTMGSAITTIMQETKAKFPAGHIMNSIQIGAIENPNFPANYVKANGTTPLTGPWTFSNPDLMLQYDYKSALYIITSFSILAAADFELVPSFDAAGVMSLTFNFKRFLGNKQPDLMFEYGAHGTISDYDLPRDGDRMVNSITGLAADVDGKILPTQKRDEASVAKYGVLEGVAAFGDVKTINALVSRLAETLLLVSTPSAEVTVSLNDRAYPLGVWGVGDIVTIKIKDHFINFQDRRRIVSAQIMVFDNGEEDIRISTNVPRSGQ